MTSVETKTSSNTQQEAWLVPSYALNNAYVVSKELVTENKSSVHDNSNNPQTQGLSPSNCFAWSMNILCIFWTSKFTIFLATNQIGAGERLEAHSYELTASYSNCSW